MSKLEEKYSLHCDTPSDINEHLPTLRRISDQCDVVVELGVRNCVSIYSMVASKAEFVVGIDIGRTPYVDELQEISNDCGKNFKFIEGDVLKMEIPECDFLFIDTFHSKLQLEQELEMHAGRVRKYIGFHDVFTFWETAEPSYQSANMNKVDGQEGLKYAIEPFLIAHPEWKEMYRTDENNGLLILEKIV